MYVSQMRKLMLWRMTCSGSYRQKWVRLSDTKVYNFWWEH